MTVSELFWGRRPFLKSGVAVLGLLGVGSRGLARAATDGGRPVVGHAGGLETLNPFEASSEASTVVLEAVYDRGIRFHPATNEPVPWVFTDWDVREENVGTDEPSVVATVREDLAWHDGEPVTAEDVAFTVEYVLETRPPGSFVPPRGFEAVSAVRTAGAEVRYVLEEAEPTWLQGILAQPVVPEHVWSGVEDPASRTPREAGGPVGSGAFEVASVEFPADEFDRSVTLDAREHPVPADVPFLGDGPFVDGLRFEFSETADALADAVFAGEVDVPTPLGGRSASRSDVDAAATARDDEDFAVAANPSESINFVGFNLRRVPLDDLAFRQFLVRAWDGRFHVEESNAGFAVDGDYAAAPPLGNYRPADPDDLAAEQFPFFDDGDGNLDVEAAREFLRNVDGDHDYSFGPVESGLVTGDRELRVDGERLPAAHTDNDGNAGAGPLVFLVNAGETDQPDDDSWNRWVEVLQEIGVPIRREDISFPEQIVRVFDREEFDAFEVGFRTSGPQLSGLDDLFAADNADLDGSTDDFRPNAMGYTGAEDALARMETMDPAAREDAARDALQTIYEDCPVNVVDYNPQLQPLSREWTGLVDAVGGVANPFSWLNVRPRVTEIAVAIDVEPGSDRNPVNPRSRGVVPVAVLNTDEVDPARVDVSSLRFGAPGVVEGGDGARPEHDGHDGDADGDGDDDLVVHFPARDAGFEDGDDAAVLVGELDDGTPIRGTADVAVVGSGRDDGNDGGRNGNGEGNAGNRGDGNGNGEGNAGNRGDSNGNGEGNAGNRGDSNGNGDGESEGNAGDRGGRNGNGDGGRGGR